ncbi:MAG: hypothetical protein JWM99_3012, partial [Verrucomicrobiales bacterium]|nr:hypothetical protein [Verrucomicrobiales bacterium]
KMTIEAITSIESEVIALQTIFLCHGVGYEIEQKDEYDDRRLQRKSASQPGE